MHRTKCLRLEMTSDAKYEVSQFRQLKNFHKLGVSEFFDLLLIEQIGCPVATRFAEEAPSAENIQEPYLKLASKQGPSIGCIISHGWFSFPVNSHGLLAIPELLEFILRELG